MIRLTPDVLDLIDRALAEDHASNDLTTSALIPPGLNAQGIIRSNEEGVVAGVTVSIAVFHRVDPQLLAEEVLTDGDSLTPGCAIARVNGKAASILRAERTALNFLQRMSGIATATSRYVRAIEGTKATIVDTRKTVPGLRSLEKSAVRAGGGRNHRINLADGILIKDNHIYALRSMGLTLKGAVKLALAQASGNVTVEVEVTNQEELEEALEAGAHNIMLDNMSVEDTRHAVKTVNGRAVIEASGGINIHTVRAVAETGVDLISIGSLTHSVTALDMSLDLEF